MPHIEGSPQNYWLTPQNLQGLRFKIVTPRTAQTAIIAHPPQPLQQSHGLEQKKRAVDAGWL